MMFHMPLFLDMQRAPNLTKLTLLTLVSRPAGPFDTFDRFDSPSPEWPLMFHMPYSWTSKEHQPDKTDAFDALFSSPKAV